MDSTHKLGAIVILLLGLTAGKCDPPPPTSPCDNVDCGQGYCFTPDGIDAYCGCYPGYAPRHYGACADDVTCAEVDCLNRGQCQADDKGIAQRCQCDADSQASQDGFYCFPKVTPDESTGDGGLPTVDCAENRDCPLQTAAYCNPEQGRCQPCRGNEDCAHLSQMVCANGTCVECTAEETAACELPRDLCHEPLGECVECLENGDCTDHGATRCHQGQCEGCTADADCAHIPGRPACVSGQCHACSADNVTACADNKPLCLLDDFLCVECRLNDDCSSPDQARCDDTSHSCGPCESNDDCLHLADLPSCDQGRCVECTSNGDCGADQVCHQESTRCVEACRPCTLGGEECASLGESFLCMQDAPAVHPAGTHCMQEPGPDGCEPPWVEYRGHCVPPSHTSCQGIVEFGEPCDPFAPGPCGADDAPRDGVCLNSEAGCTYYCNNDGECPPGTTCSGTPQVCRAVTGS